MNDKYDNNIKYIAKSTKDFQQENIAEQIRMEKRDKALKKEIKKLQMNLKRLELQITNDEKRLREISKEQLRFSKLKVIVKSVTYRAEKVLPDTVLNEIRQIKKTFNENNLTLFDSKLTIKNVPIPDLENYKAQIDKVSERLYELGIRIEMILNKDKFVTKNNIQKTPKKTIKNNLFDEKK